MKNVIKWKITKASIQCFLIILFSITSISCAVVIGNGVKQGPIKGSLLSSKDNEKSVEELAKSNNAAIQLYQNEWQYNRTDKNTSPKLCLAMSGGGIRSASFNIGVLQGLQEKGLLPEIDVISGVSGGTHALSWYYLQLYKYYSDYRLTDELIRQLGIDKSELANVDLLQNQIFGSAEELKIFLDEKLGNQLVKNKQTLIALYGRFANDRFSILSDNNLTQLSKKSDMYGFAALMSTAMVNLVMSPVNFLVNGVFSGNVNTTSQRAYYEHMIKRTFHSKPGSLSLDLEFLNMEEISFGEMAAFIKTNNLAYFIINTSADIDNDSHYYKSKLKNSVFEFTPLRIGSDGFGYSENQDYSIGLAVSISSAALDSTIVPGKINSLLGSAMNMDLGYYIKNYHKALPSETTQMAKRLTPFPFYYLWTEDPHRRDQLGMDIYLTDGGHTDNLATYSLVRRACEHIIIVDAEYDPDYQFASYKKLKNVLLSEMQLELDVPGISDFLFKNDENNDVQQDAVLTGELRNIIRLAENKEIYFQKTKVTYIKLSVKDELLKSIGGEKERFNLEFPDNTKQRNEAGIFLHYNNTYCKKTGKIYKLIFGCEFPHYTTIDQSYTNDQFRAYTYLGYSIVRHSEKIPDRN